uniref:CoA-transferase n=1 Tax=Rhizomonospora bruguierae TaxID=1581705 RepID=UPI001BCC30AF
PPLQYYRAVPETMLTALADRFTRSGTPRGLTVVAVSMIERTRGGVGGDETGLNRLAVEGLMDTLVSGSFSRAPTREINRLIRENRVAAYNFPMGSVIQWLRSIGAGSVGLSTRVGLGTYIDPRLEGGRMNDAAVECRSRIIEIDGQEHIFYPSTRIDIGLVKATAADERGNLYVHGQAFDHGLFDVVLATHNSGGKVIAEVDRIIRLGDLPARFVRVPGAMVDAAVVRGDEPWEDEQDPALIGAQRVELPSPANLGRVRDLVAELAVQLLPEGSTVNLGAGIPMYDVPEAARRRGRQDIYFTVEQGPMGGWPQVGGVSRNPEAVLDQFDVFTFYEGGSPDVAVLSFGQVDASGNVNVSRFGQMMVGCGGFPNIAHGIRRLLFCGTLTTGGLRERIEQGRLVIDQEGTIDRFVGAVEQITFNGQRALRDGHHVTFVTERAIFSLRESGLRLDAIVRGVTVERDIRGHVPFHFDVSPNLSVIDPSDPRTAVDWAALTASPAEIRTGLTNQERQDA